jgi:hypothetical protein
VAERWIIGFEVLAVISMLIVLLIQRPGVATEKYAQRHDQVELQRERAQVAKATEKNFGASHPTANFILFRGGGVMLFAGGLAIILVSAPLDFDPKWITSVLIGVGLAIQIAAVVLTDFWGVSLSIQISKSVRSANPD